MAKRARQKSPGLQVASQVRKTEAGLHVASQVAAPPADDDVLVEAAPPDVVVKQEPQFCLRTNSFAVKPECALSAPALAIKSEPVAHAIPARQCIDLDDSSSDSDAGEGVASQQLGAQSASSSDGLGRAGMIAGHGQPAESTLPPTVDMAPTPREAVTGGVLLDLAPAPREAVTGGAPADDRAARGHAFQNTMRSAKCPQFVKDHWAVMKTKKLSDPGRIRFVDMVVGESLRTQFDTELFTEILTVHEKTIVEQKSARVREGWKSYKFVADREGKEMTDELMRTKQLTCKRHPLLAEDSQVVYPHTQQIWWSETMFEKLEAETETLKQRRVNHSDDPDTAEAFDQVFTAARANRARPQALADQPPPGGPQVGQEVVPPGPPLIGKEELAAAAKTACVAHQEWDSRHRRLKAIIGRSKACDATKGTPIQKQLETLIKEGTTADKILTDFDERCLQNLPCNN